MPLIEGFFSDQKVLIDGELLDIEPSLRIRTHSPTGFSWGYSGSGPAQLSLAILLKFTDQNTAQKLYHDFKWDFISKLPQKDFGAMIDVQNWIKKHKDKRGSSRQ